MQHESVPVRSERPLIGFVNAIGGNMSMELNFLVYW